MEPVTEALTIDCDRCLARGPGCADCVISVLLGPPTEHPEPVRLDPEERRALHALSDAGVLPPLRLLRAVDTVRGPERRLSRSEEEGLGRAG